MRADKSPDIEETCDGVFVIEYGAQETALEKYDTWREIWG